jgi:hypothetical protein
LSTALAAKKLMNALLAPRRRPGSRELRAQHDGVEHFVAAQQPCVGGQRTEWLGVQSGIVVGALYRNLNDPRVPVVHPANLPDATIGVPLWIQPKYTSASAPIPIASRASTCTI